MKTTRLNKEREELRNSGGVYIKVVQSVKQSIKDGKDWTWIQDKVTKERYLASDFEKFAQKYRTRANNGRSQLVAAPLSSQAKMHFLLAFYVTIWGPKT